MEVGIICTKIFACMNFTKYLFLVTIYLKVYIYLVVLLKGLSDKRPIVKRPDIKRPVVKRPKENILGHFILKYF